EARRASEGAVPRWRVGLRPHLSRGLYGIVGQAFQPDVFILHRAYFAFHSRYETTLTSGRGSSGRTARYSSRCPSGSTKYRGTQPITSGSSGGSLAKLRGVTPAARSLAGAARAASIEQVNAKCRRMTFGPVPTSHSPSMDWRGAPIQKKATRRSSRTYASSRP